MSKFTVFVAFVLGILLVFVDCQTSENNVLDFGAVGDGLTDDTNAFQEAWEATCRSESSPTTMHIPSNMTFLLQPVLFSGPCQSHNKINVVIDGTLIAPSDPYDWSECDNDGDCNHWIAFKDVDNMNIYGSGTVNPNGEKWWTNYCYHSHKHCPNKPNGFIISHSYNVGIRGLEFKDSPKMHLAIESSESIRIRGIRIVAPRHSPNTDGIHVQNSQDVVVEHTQIGTGDDCISIGDGTSNLRIRNIKCGPGHGISIGSLGKHGQYETVENVRVTDVVFNQSTNGVRIKTWQGGRGYVKNVIFERITSKNAERPIIIDQYYCDHEHCTNHTSAVQISNITYNNVKGTTNSKKAAIEFLCSKSFPCKDINMHDINIKSSRSGKKSTSLCSNIIGKIIGTAIPSVSCLEQSD